MASIFFKTRFVPNADGTDSTTAITSTNTAFVHTYQGDDLTGDGTRAKPYRSVNKASQKSGISYIVFRGVVNEYFNTSKTIIGDDINQVFLYSNYQPVIQNLLKATFDYINNSGYQSLNLLIQLNDSITQNLASYYNCSYLFYFNLISIGFGTYSNFTINDCKITNSLNENFACKWTNLIIVNSLNITISNVIPFRYCIFPTSCKFYYKNTLLTSPVWTSDNKANVQLIRNVYISAGMSSADALALFFQDSFGNETCRVVLEQRNGGTSANIFNRYDASGNVLDYNLNPDSSNEALYASDTGGYVGCFKPASEISSVSGNTLDTVINVNADGSDDTVAGTLLVKNSDDTLTFDSSSAQTWNRLKGNTTIKIPNGIKFNGIGGSFTDGSAFGNYFGKHQNLINPTGLTPADTLLANTWYKVCNSARDIYSAIVYNNNQYLPDYFFFTGTGPTSFSLLDSDSGTVVKQVLASPFQSIEIIPYDDMTTPSVSLPEFSAPLGSDCKMLFYKAGNSYSKTAGTPVLFGDTQVAAMTDKISYYAPFAVTNADQEFVTLSQDTTNYYYDFPVLSYLRVVVNAHRNTDYDQ